MSKQLYFQIESGLLDGPELRKLRILFFLHSFLLVTAIIMPQYFGVHIVWDITCTRFANILLILYSLFNINVIIKFIEVCVKSVVSIPLFLYLFVAGYTMVLRADINAFVMPLLEILTFFMMIFGIRYVLGYKRALSIINKCSVFLGIYGFAEFGAGRSLMMMFLRTMPSSGGSIYRSGHYRIMGPCGHPLGYGLLLLILIAIACIDDDKDEVYLFKRPFLLFLLVANVLLTGSRSSQGIMLLELFLLFLASKSINKKKALFFGVMFVMVLSIFLIVGFKTKIGNYILLQITTLIDQLFHTQLSAAFGAQVSRLEDSEDYRKFLPYIFTLDWLNPLVGRGVKRSFSGQVFNKAGEYAFIQSIDNYYVSQYIKYAYPGLVSYVCFVLVAFVCMVRDVIRYKSGKLLALLICTFCYFLNLWWVDALQTLKFIYIVIALFWAIVSVYKEEISSDEDCIIRA